MASPHLNFFVLFWSIILKRKSFSLMMPICPQRSMSYQWLNFWRKKGLFLLEKFTTRSRLLSCMLLKSTPERTGPSSCAGATTINWKVNQKRYSLEKQKAPICGRSFFNIVRCRWELDNTILASREFICNNSVRCYV